jgi:ADP-ribosylglycohydrolase
VSRVHDRGGRSVSRATHSGDSDSTGAITGNLLGAALGEHAIPSRWLEALELQEVIEAVADDVAAFVLHGSVDATRYPPY